MSGLEQLRQLREKVRDLGREKERAAIALLALSFFGILYLLVALNAPPGWGPAFGALSACYLTAFMALGSEWFWARWFASGLGWSGFMVGLMSLVMVGWHPSLAVYAGLHGLVVAMLVGKKMAARYDLQPAWRERYAMDEYGVTRLGKAVTRASASLPTLILWALAPREGEGGAILGGVALALAATGLVGVLRLRGWGLAAMTASGLLAGVALFTSQEVVSPLAFEGPFSRTLALLASPALAAGWSALAFAPLALPAWRFLRIMPR